MASSSILVLRCWSTSRPLIGGDGVIDIWRELSVICSLEGQLRL